MQTKKKSIIEACTNTVLGLVVSFLIQLAIYPILDIEVKIHENIIITFVFLLASFFRSYIIRRIFNRHENIQTKNDRRAHSLRTGDHERKRG